MKVTIACVGKLKEKYLVEAVGEYGLAWDSPRWPRLVKCKGYNMGKTCPYEVECRVMHQHFALIPGFPISELLKRITGYEVTSDARLHHPHQVHA